MSVDSARMPAPTSRTRIARGSNGGASHLGAHSVSHSRWPLGPGALHVGRDHITTVGSIGSDHETVRPTRRARGRCIDHGEVVARQPRERDGARRACTRRSQVCCECERVWSPAPTAGYARSGSDWALGIEFLPSSVIVGSCDEALVGRNAQKSASERCRCLFAADPKPQTLIDAESEQRTRHSTAAPSPARQLGSRAATIGTSVGGVGFHRPQEVCITCKSPTHLSDLHFSHTHGARAH